MSVTRVIEVSALEAARLRLAAWWATLSRREQWLVGIAAALLTVLALVFLVVKPLQAARAQALADIRTYETLKARITAAGALGPSGPPPRTGTAPEMLNAAAAATALTVQVAPTAGGATATLTDASYDAVVNWLADVARTTGLTMTRAELRRGGTDGRVSGTVEFRG